MFCYKCGNKLPDDAAFCNSCGAKMPANGTQKQENGVVGTNLKPETAETVLFTKEETPISIGQAPQTEAAVHTQPSSSVSDSNIYAALAIAGVPTEKKKSKAPIIITAAVVLVIAATVTAFMLWTNSDSYNDKKSDNPSIETPVSEGHHTDDIFIETPVIEGHYTVGFLKKFFGCTPEEIEEIFGEIQTDNVSSYGDNLNLEYSYDGIKFLFVGNHLSEIFVSPEILEQKGETLDKTSDEIEKFLGEPFEFTPYYYDENDSEKMTSYDLRYILGDVSMRVGVNCEPGKVNGVSLSSYSIHDLLGLASLFGKSVYSVIEEMPGAKYAHFDSFIYETYARYDDMTLHFEGSDGGLISITDISPDIVSFHLKTLDKTRPEIINLIGQPTEELETAADHKMIYDFPDYGVTVEISMLNANSKAESVSIYALVDESAAESVIINGVSYSVKNTTELILESEEWELIELSDEDIANIGRLVNLKVLDFSSCRINDITFLEGLTKLTSLDLGGNYIRDITPLKHLTNLTSLSISIMNCNINSLTSLTNLTNLVSLEIGGQPEYEETYIDSNDCMKIIQSLTKMKKLTTLQLTGISIDNACLTAIADLTNLTSLDLTYCGLDDITPLKKMTGLNSLRLFYNGVGNIAPLANLTNLTELDLGMNDIEDIAPLANLTKLTTLSLQFNYINDLTQLKNLTNLTSLNLSSYNLSNNEINNEDLQWLQSQLPDCVIIK